jgi:hypothetical protein
LLKLLFLAAVAIIGYMLYQNSKVDPQFSRTDGWESTARNRRPNMPSPAVGEETPMYHPAANS